MPGTQGELFDRTPIDKPKVYEGFKEQRNFLDEAGKVAEFIKGDDGSLIINLDTIAKAAAYTLDAMRRVAGKAVPTTTRLSRATGESLMRWMVSGRWGRDAAPHYTDRVVGRNATTADRVYAGALITEMRLGHMRATYRRLGTRPAIAAAKAAAQAAETAAKAAEALARRTYKAARGTPPGSQQWAIHEAVKAAKRQAQADARTAARKARLAGKADRIANKVQSVIGMRGSPFATHAEFVAFKNSPKGREIQKNWKNEFVPVMDSLYRRAQGLNPNAPINTVTQIPGFPVNLHPVDPQSQMNRPGIATSSTPKNLKFRKYVHAEQAEGSADAYHLDIADIIGNSLDRGAKLAAQAEFGRTAVDEGQAIWAPPGRALPGYKEVPFTAPPRGTQKARRNDVLHVKEDIHGETMRGFNSDTPEKAIRILSYLNTLPVMANLASIIDATTHGTNLGLSMMAPSGKWLGMTRNAGTAVYQKLMGSEPMRRQLLELTRIGANKSHSTTKGMIHGMLQTGADLAGKQLPEKAEKVKWVDPTFYMTKLVDGMSDVMRVALAEAYKTQVKRGMVADTETGMRDFINQWTGNYEGKALTFLVKIFRETGFGPFVVAGTTMNARAIKLLLGGDASLRGQTWKSEVRLRMEFLAKIASVLALGALYNYLRWGRMDGDDNTPRFAIKWAEAEDGKTKYIPNPVGQMINRGVRAIPFLSYYATKMSGHYSDTEAESKVYDLYDAWAHPFMGPTLQFVHTLVTGNDSMGKKISLPPGEESSKPRENLKAAVKQLNPVVSSLTGAYDPTKEIPLNERLARLMGPFGFRYAEKQPLEVTQLYDRASRLREVHDGDRRTANKVGEMAPRDGALNILTRAETAISKLERARHVPGLSKEERDTIRAQQVSLAKEAMEASKELRKK